MPNLDAIRLVDHPPQNFTPKPAKPKRRFWKWLILLALIIALLGWGGAHLLAKANQIFTKRGNILTRVSSLFISADKPLIGEDQGSVNVLLMGVGGDGHDGAYLTDTMIVAQINTQTHEVVLTSIPRDFALDLPKIGYNKINAAYAYAYRDDPITAGDAAIAAAEQVTGLTIPYYAVIDFKGFVKAVDDVGGVDVTVDNTFTDSTFPNDYPYDTKGYLAPVTFTKGPAHMDGRTALIFARSRHSDNANEGSDFARSERQKKILVALRDKVLTFNLTSLSTINNLLGDFTDNFRTNLEPYELKRLVDIAQQISPDNIYSFSLEPQDNLICSELVDANTGQRIISTPTPAPATPATAAPPASTSTSKPSGTTTTPAPAAPTTPTVVPMYVIVPCAGKTLADIQQFVTQAPVLAKLKKEAATIEIQNSTNQASAVNKFLPLEDLGMTVKTPVFRGKVAYTQTILYDNSHGSKPHTLDYLKSKYSFVTSDVGFPTSSADFVIILGQGGQ